MEQSGTQPDVMSFFPPWRTPRPEQTKAIRDVEGHFNAGTKTVVFQGPTGIGKSYVAACFFRQASDHAQNVHLLTAQKMLMDQYSSEFASPDVEVIKGRSNYSCSLEPWRANAARGKCRSKDRTALIQECMRFGTVEEAMKFEVSPEAHKCPYWAQLATSISAPVTLYNFHSFLFQQRLGRFGVRDLMVLDECHNAENVLLQFVQVIISGRTLALVDIEIDLTLKKPSDVVAWLDREQVEKRIKESLGGAAETEDAAAGFTPEDTDRLRGLLQRLKDLRRFFEMTDWVVDVTEEGDDDEDRTRKLRIRPVYISPFGKELIFSKANRILAMSATILNAGIWAKNLGLSQKAIAYVEAPCPFPVRNRPIILEYAGDMSWKNQQATLPKFYSTIARILERHHGQRGIIHAHSERICKLILENVHSPRFVHLDQFKMRDKTALLKTHQARADSVIVASAMHEGVDLKDDLARFQIIAKVPWPMMDDALVKARMESDKWFMPYNTSLKLVQSYGRAVRHKDDWATTYVLDSGFEHFMKQAAWLLPVWFKEAIQFPARR